MLREGLFSHHRRDSLYIPALGTTAVAQAAIGPVPEGYAWYLEAWAFFVQGDTHTANLALAISPDNGARPAASAFDFAGVVSTLGAAIFGSLVPGTSLHIPPGHFLIPYLFGGTIVSGDVVTFSYQAAVHQLNPQAIMSPEDRRQVAAAHQNLSPEHQLVESAVASRRAV